MTAVLRPVLAAAAAAALVLAAPVLGQEDAGPKKLTLEDVFSLGEKMAPKAPRRLGWLDGRTYVAHDELGDAEEKSIVRVDAESGEQRPLIDAAAMRLAFAALPSVTDEEAERWSGTGSPTFTDAYDGVLLERKNDLFFWRLGADRAVRLTHDPDEEVGATLSPDGRWVAYIHEYDLHVVSTAGGTPRALTSGGDENTLLGRLDWVYQEEIYGRGNWGGFWWSPDSTRLAFLALDESPVPEYVVVDHRETRPSVERWRYPKAGDPNPKVRLGVVDAGGGDVTWVDLERYAHDGFLIVRVGWTPDGERVVAQVQDRIQTWLDVVLADPASGETTVLFRDETGVWVEPTDAPFWTAAGERFVWLSERDGFRHLYLYARDGTLVRRLTEGEWEVDDVHGVDEGRDVVWFSGDRDDVKGRKLFHVPLEGGAPVRVTPEEGQHAVSLSPTFDLFVDEWSSLTDPGWVAVRRADGAQVRVIAEGTKEPLEPFGLNDPRFVQVETRDGFAMEAMLIEPPGFDPSRKYPVLCYTYAGPHAPQVQDRFTNRSTLFHQMLAQEGLLIWVCDNRSAGGRGLESVKGIYRNLGAQELDDLEDGLDALIGMGFADPERIGMWGWSYGGYMTAYALTHSKRFRCGIAGAPVTDWRYYDTIYTERYMDTPQANPEGYRRSSVAEAAGDLHGDLLLIHGAIDENVHLQNTLNLALALQEAGKPFDMMIYPGNRHAVRKKKQREHLYGMMGEWLLERLR